MSRLNQSGYLLIENLIAIAILAVGLLGVSAMQLTALKGGQGAIERGEISLLMSNMTERMRANTSAVLAGDYRLRFTGTAPSTISAATSAKQVANNDHAEWIKQLISTLGSGNMPQAGITCNARVCTLTVKWRDQHGKTQTELAYGDKAMIQDVTTTVIF